MKIANQLKMLSTCLTTIKNPWAKRSPRPKAAHQESSSTRGRLPVARPNTSLGWGYATRDSGRANNGYSRYRFSLKGPGMRSTQKRLRPPLTHDGTTRPVMIVETWLNISDGYKRHKVEGIRVGYSNTEFFYISTFLYFLGFLFLIPWGVLK